MTTTTNIENLSQGQGQPFSLSVTDATPPSAVALQIYDEPTKTFFRVTVDGEQLKRAIENALNLPKAKVWPAQGQSL